MSLPYGYEEWVGERGVTLSGGQKQRIAIARTLLLDPKLLIFDDSTASVDSQTEFLIRRAPERTDDGQDNIRDRQRLRTVMRADEILVLKGGRVVQRGKHAELLEQEGLYRRIFDLELRETRRKHWATHAEFGGSRAWKLRQWRRVPGGRLRRR